jgi:hypothetical protein
MTDTDVIRTAYEDDAIESPLQRALAQLPHLDKATASRIASREGFARIRRERRVAAGLPVGKSMGGRKPGVKNGEGVKVRRQQKPAPKTFPDAKAVPKYREGACDRGDREAIRRRVLHVIAALSGEIRRAPVEVAKAIKAIAADNFRGENPLGATYNLSDLADIVSGAHRAEASRSAVLA